MTGFCEYGHFKYAATFLICVSKQEIFLNTPCERQVTLLFFSLLCENQRHFFHVSLAETVDCHRQL